MRYAVLFVVIWAEVFTGIMAFNACGGSQPPQGETAVRAAIDIIEFICPPEITVGDCHSRIRAWLPGKDGG